jgi:nitrogen-specific signal transduction histidine kinase
MSDLFQKVERAKKEWETTVDAICENVALYDNDSLTIQRANWSMAKLFNTTPPKLAGANLHSKVCGCKEEDCTLRDFLKSSEANTQEIERQNGKVIWSLSVYPVPKDEVSPSYNVIVLRDITKERIWQQRLLKAEQNSSMVRTAARLAYQITPSVEYIRHRLYIISQHLPELRSAFCDYRIALQVNGSEQSSCVASDWTTIESRHKVEFLIQDIEESLRQSIRDLNRIYNVIDDLHNLGSSASRIQYIDLNNLLENMLELIQTDTMGRLSMERCFEWDIPLVRCNQLRIQTALLNLLVNAIQAVQNSGALVVQTRKKDEGVEIIIKNSGTSGETKSLTDTQITYWFNDGDSNTLEAGLHTASWIIQEHGGKVWVDDRSEHTFQAGIYLPIHGPVDIGSDFTSGRF